MSSWPASAAIASISKRRAQGIPLLCLHTAGADSRQYRHLLNDASVTPKYRVIAFDMPYHGRSNPPDGWWLKKYKLTTADYIAQIRAVWKALDLTRPVVLGCSMGGAIVLKLAADYPEGAAGHRRPRKLGVRAGTVQRVPASSRDSRRRARGQLHLRPVRAESPEANARENWWYYSQSGPGVYAGDVHFYSLDWDGREDLTRIDTSVCRVSLLTGEPTTTRARRT